jgi:hypothetical protein
MPEGRVDAFARHAISGWAADIDRPDAKLEVAVFVDGREQGRTIANRPREDLRALGTLGNGAHGFVYAFDPPLSPLRSYEIMVTEVGSLEPLQRGLVTIPAEINHAAERMRPILVTTSGEPGFTDLMRALASDPGIIATDSHSYGVKLMSYYAHALEVLLVPNGQGPNGQGPNGQGPNGQGANGQGPIGQVPGGHKSNRQGGTDDTAFILKPNPFHSADYEAVLPRPRLLYEYFQSQSARPIAGAFKTVISEFYEMMAMHHGKRMADYFAEQSDLFGIERNFARLAFRDTREIVLLQDPRDAYCGCRQLWSTSPTQALDNLRRVRDRTIALRRENRHDMMFLRTEDFRLRPESALREISGFLALDHTILPEPGLLRAAAGDATTSQIGRWRTELDAEETDLFAREFADYLQLFGYPAPPIKPDRSRSPRPPSAGGIGRSARTRPPAPKAPASS